MTSPFEAMDEQQNLAQRITTNWIARADRLEDYWRDYAFLGLNEELRIAGGRKIEVLQLTLRMFIQLCAVRSPFLVGGRVGSEHVAQILWRLSPKYNLPLPLPLNPNLKGKRTDSEEEVAGEVPLTPRQVFVASIADLPFAGARRSITRYLDRMLIDKPPSAPKSTGGRADTSFAASAIHQLAKTYGWNDEAILDLPMPRLFQYMRKIHRDADPELLRFNPVRDKFAKLITDKVIEARKAARRTD